MWKISFYCFLPFQTQEEKTREEKMSTCEGCSLPISGNAKALSIGGKTFHAACFVCSKCTSSLLNAQVSEVNGEFVCGSCLEQIKAEMAAAQAKQPQRATAPAAKAAPPQAGSIFRNTELHRPTCHLLSIYSNRLSTWSCQDCCFYCYTHSWIIWNSSSSKGSSSTSTSCRQAGTTIERSRLLCLQCEPLRQVLSFISIQREREK